MQKMKKILTIFLILSTISIISCKSNSSIIQPISFEELSVPPVNYKYDREEVDKIMLELSLDNKKLLVKILNEYTANLTEWENWKNSVKEILDGTHSD